MTSTSRTRKQNDEHEADIGETKNLAVEKPELVKELDSLIDTFHKNTGALIPAKNPTFNPKEEMPPVGKIPAKRLPSRNRPSSDARIELERESDEGTHPQS